MSIVPRQSRSIVCHGLQVDTARTSNARETDNMREVIGLDFYNQCITGGVSITLRAAAGGVDTTPCVLIGEEDASDRKYSRPSYPQNKDR